MCSFNPPKNLTRRVLPLSPFYRGGIEGTEKLIYPVPHSWSGTELEFKKFGFQSVARKCRENQGCLFSETKDMAFPSAEPRTPQEQERTIQLTSVVSCTWGLAEGMSEYDIFTKMKSLTRP